MIAKKLQTVICTLLTVALIVTITSGCAKKEENGTPTSSETPTVQAMLTPWEWAQNVTAARLGFPTDDSQRKALAKILNTLVEADFTQIDTWPTYLGHLYIGSLRHPYTLTYSEHSESVTLKFGDTIWQVHNSDLTSFLVQTLDQEYSVNLEALSWENTKDTVTGEKWGIYHAGAPELTLYLSDGTACNTYTCNDANAYYEIAMSLEGYLWTQLDEKPEALGDYWITAVYNDGEKALTFRQDDDFGTVEYSYGYGAYTTYWRAKAVYSGSRPIAERIRERYYDELDFDYKNIPFDFSGSVEEAAEVFATETYVDHMNSLAPGSIYTMKEFNLLEWGVTEVREDGNAVVGYAKYVFDPVNVEAPSIWNSNIGKGAGEYEGKYIAYRAFSLLRQKDGSWSCHEVGNGNIVLP